MIKAAPSEQARSLAVRYFRRRVRKSFAGMHVAGLEHLAAWDRNRSGSGPLLIVASHTSWWDAVMPILLSFDLCNLDAYGVMEEAQLARYRFFRRLGMFSINPDDPRSAIESLRYGSELLTGTNRVLWYFPQGEIVPSDRRPIEVRSGTGRLIDLTEGLTLLPVAFQYELLDNERPDIWTRIGAPVNVHAEPARSANRVSIVQNELTRTMNRVREDVIERNFGAYQTVLTGHLSVDRWWDKIRGKASGTT